MIFKLILEEDGEYKIYWLKYEFLDWQLKTLSRVTFRRTLYTIYTKTYCMFRCRSGAVRLDDAGVLQGGCGCVDCVRRDAHLHVRSGVQVEGGPRREGRTARPASRPRGPHRQQSARLWHLRRIIS